jgi:hypothetical protein
VKNEVVDVERSYQHGNYWNEIKIFNLLKISIIGMEMTVL